MNAKEFNSRYPVGTPVMAYPGIRPEDPVAVAYQERLKAGHVQRNDSDPCTRLETATRTPAWALGHGEPVVSVHGYPGGISLEHVDVIEGAPLADPANPPRPIIRDLVERLQVRASYGRPCFVKRSTYEAALIVPHLGGGAEGPYSWLVNYRRRTVDEAVELGLVVLGDDMVVVPDHAGDVGAWYRSADHFGRTISLPAAPGGTS